MATRKNLCIVPALKIDTGAPGAPWVGGGDWARTTSAHASLPRTTAYAGTTAVTGLICSQATSVTPGRYYVVSVSIRAVATQTATLNIDWKTSGNVYLSTTSGTGSTYGVISMTSSSTNRFAIIGLAPATAAKCVPIVAGVDAGGAQVTACMIREFTTLPDAEAAIELDRLVANYFDGDTANAVWDGGDGESTSTLTVDEPPQLTAPLDAPTASLTPQQTILGVELVAELASPQAAIGLIVTVRYDSNRGRIRITAQGLVEAAVRAIVSHRVSGGAAWTEVRGGRVAVVDGAFVRTVDDYEYRAGAAMQYRIQVLSSSEGEPDVIVQTRIVEVDATEQQAWIKVIASPSANRRVSLLGWGPVVRRSRNSVYEVQNRVDPVAITDVHGTRSMPIRVAAHTIADRDALDKSLSAGAAIYWQTPAASACPTMYAVVGDHSWEPAARRSVRAIFTIGLTEVAAPPPSVVGMGLAYAVLATQYGSYSDLGEAGLTYAELGA